MKHQFHEIFEALASDCKAWQSPEEDLLIGDSSQKLVAVQWKICWSNVGAFLGSCLLFVSIAQISKRWSKTGPDRGSKPSSDSFVGMLTTFCTLFKD